MIRSNLMGAKRPRILTREQFQQWGKRGGKRRAKNLTAGQLSEQGKVAAAARWKKAKRIA